MIDALVISILTAAPVLALRFGWVEQSAATVVIAGVAFCYFSLLKRHRFFDRSKPRAAATALRGGRVLRLPKFFTLTRDISPATPRRSPKTGHNAAGPQFASVPGKNIF